LVEAGLLEGEGEGEGGVCGDGYWILDIVSAVSGSKARGCVDTGDTGGTGGAGLKPRETITADQGGGDEETRDYSGCMYVCTTYQAY